MSLKDRIIGDIHRVFLREQHFASKHNWNGTEITCVMDSDTALKRRNNNVVDVGWDNNTSEVQIYVAIDQMPTKPQPSDHILFDGCEMKVSNVCEDEGVYNILLTAQVTRGITL